jgi:hypothetical protein
MRPDPVDSLPGLLTVMDTVQALTDPVQSPAQVRDAVRALYAGQGLTVDEAVLAHAVGLHFSAGTPTDPRVAIEKAPKAPLTARPRLPLPLVECGLVALILAITVGMVGMLGMRSHRALEMSRHEIRLDRLAALSRLDAQDVPVVVPEELLTAEGKVTLVPLAGHAVEARLTGVSEATCKGMQAAQWVLHEPEVFTINGSPAATVAACHPSDNTLAMHSEVSTGL